MIMYMSDIICITNRKLCREDFLTRIVKIAACHPAGIILREKDLTPDKYRELAVKVTEICAQYKVRCILHNFTDVALRLKADALHLPLHILRDMTEEYMDIDRLMELVAAGKVAIPTNINHKCLNPEGIGSMLRTKINVNLGVSRDCKDYDIEMQMYSR